MTANEPSASGPSSDALGARLQAALGAEYAVERPLGAGGFAVVFLVRDLRLKRLLAIKVLSPDVIASHSALERFRREAETVARLSHPNIVPLHFIGQQADLVYLVMQAVDGGSLAERMQREKRLAVDEAARIISEVASALGHAHKHGVVHRDVKPQNVLLDADTGRALVTDFGIARTADSGGLTATGLLVGTPAYLSPEQITGEPTDHRVDIYALGVMAYEMFAGEPPFAAPTPTAVLMKRLAGPPPPLRSVRPDIPDALDELINACLAADPDQRIQSAADVVRAITTQSPVSGAHITRAQPQPSKPKARARTIVIAALLIVAAGAAFAARQLVSGDPIAAAPSPVDSGMVIIPAGTYMIGSNDEEGTRPSHAVQLATFALDAREVTMGQYRQYVEARQVPAPWDTISDAALPVTHVRFAEAENYCRWRHPDGGRVPTEEEWEAAARGIEGRKYPWGREWKADAANVANIRGGPVPVGSYPQGRTPDGIDDLIGNVWEWTSTPYAPYGQPNAASSGMYVIRGGGYSALQAVANAIFRGRADPQTDRVNLAATGFRCAMPPRSMAPR